MITNPLYWLTLFDRIDHPLSGEYPLQRQSQLRYRLHLQTYFDDSRFSVIHYQTLMDAYRATYGSIITSVQTYSTFVHGDQFTRHHQLISTQMLKAN